MPAMELVNTVVETHVTPTVIDRVWGATPPIHCQRALVEATCEGYHRIDRMERVQIHLIALRQVVDPVVPHVQLRIHHILRVRIAITRV